MKKSPEPDGNKHSSLDLLPYRSVNICQRIIKRSVTQDRYLNADVALTSRQGHTCVDFRKPCRRTIHVSNSRALNKESLLSPFVFIVTHCKM